MATTAAAPLTIAGRAFTSRLILGTGGFPSLDLLESAIATTETDMVTVALRRIDAAGRTGLVEVLDRTGVQVLPNTAGCFTARDAVPTPASRFTGTPARSTISARLYGLRMPIPLPIGEPSGMTAAHPTSSSLRASTGSSVV